MRDINEAPEEFRERLLALKKAGVLDDPKFMQAFLDAVKEVAAKQKALGVEDSRSESSPKPEDQF